MEKNTVGKGVIFMYVQLISTMISGYVFYILLARIAPADVIGTFSLVISISEISANIAIIGIPDGIQRLFGKSYLQNRIEDAKLLVKVSLVFLSASIIVSSIVIIFLSNWLSQVFEIDANLIVIIVILIASYTIYTLLYSVIVASLRTKSLAVIVSVSSIAKVCLAIGLVLLGAGVIGLSLGYTFFAQILSSVLLGIILIKIFEKSKKSLKQEISFKKASKNLLFAGMVVWIPTLVTTLGIDLGTLVLYNIHGAYQSGIYFVTFAISNALNAITFSIFAIALPVLSSMADGRKRFAWNTIRLGSIVAMPLSSSLVFYSGNIMQLIGSNYVEGSFSLQILLMSIFPNLIFAGVETLVFSYGQYRHTLILNLASSIPRTVLYFALVPFFGMSGVAMSYIIGSLIGLIASWIIAKKIRMMIYWKILALTLVLPMLIGLIMSTLNVNYIIGIISTIAISYLAFMKLGIVLDSDISYFTELMPYQISRTLTYLFKKLKR